MLIGFKRKDVINHYRLKAGRFKLRLKVVFKNKTRNIKQRHSGERRNPDSATFSWIPDQVRNDVKIRAKALHLKGEGFRPGEWKNKNDNIVVALTPKGLHDWYYGLIKKSGAIVFELKDTPKNILDRIVFYDENSNFIEKDLSEDDKLYYLSEIKKDISYYRKFSL